MKKAIQSILIRYEDNSYTEIYNTDLQKLLEVREVIEQLEIAKEISRRILRI